MPSILIIDDEPGIRRTFTSSLEDEKYKVFSAEDALAGIEILKSEIIDIVFPNWEGWKRWSRFTPTGRALKL